MKAVGYVHAPAAQTAHPRRGPQSQRERIARYVADRGWELVDVYEDEPGPRRPQLARLEREIGAADKVVIVNFNRLPHSVDEALGLMKRLRGAGVALICLEEGFDTSEATGARVMQVLNVVSAWQRSAEDAYAWSAESLRKLGFAPATLIDVGVAYGTGQLYEAFPEAYLVLVEPLAEFEEHLSRLVAERPGEYILAAAGSSNGRAHVNVNLDLSSLLSSLRVTDAPDELREVPLVTLDGLRAERGWTPPFGLKIDTEGFEYEVIKGASALLEETQFVLAEVTVSDRYGSGYSFAQFVSLMEERGFRLCDVLYLARPRRDGDVQYMDALFRRNE
jgi:FkbM family methyltransferase